MSLKIRSSLAYRSQELVEHCEEELLDLYVSESAPLVVSLKFVKVFIFRQILLECIRFAERVKVCEYGISFYLARILYSEMARICEHRHHLLAQSLFIIRQIDRVAERLRHLCLSVCSRKSKACFIRRQIDLRLDKHFLAVGPVERPYDLSALLEHRLLIFAYRNDSCLEGCDIACLAYRICEESDRNALAFEASELQLGLYGRVPLHPAYCYKVHVVNGQLVQLRHLRLYEHVSLFRVESYGKVVDRYLEHALSYFFRIVEVVGQSLSVCDHYEHLLIARVFLELESLSERSDIMSDMESSCWAVARQHYLFLFVSHFVPLFVFMCFRPIVVTIHNCL